MSPVAMSFVPTSLTRPTALSAGNQHSRPLSAKVHQGDTVHFLGRPLVSQPVKLAFVEYVKTSEKSDGPDARQTHEIKDADYLERLRDQFVDFHPFADNIDGQQDKNALKKTKPNTLQNWLLRVDWQEGGDSNITTI